MVGTVHGPLDGRKELVLDVGERSDFHRHEDHGAKLVRDHLMGTLKDCIGLRVGSRGSARADTIGLEELLEFESGEFGSFVVEAHGRTGIAAKPRAVEGTGDSTAFFIGDGNKFDEICGRINHREGQDLGWV